MASFAFTVDTSKFEKLAVDVGKLDDQANRQLTFEALAASRLGVVEARRHAPIFRGRLAGGIKVVKPIVISGPRGSSVTVGITVDEDLGLYPEVMESGRAPGSKGPPIRVMENYITAKVAQGQFDISGYTGKDKIRSAAFALSRSIGIKGTKPHNFIQKGSLVMIAALTKGINRVVRKFISRFDRGG